MRNLKKIAALGLSLMMTLGVAAASLTAPASAASTGIKYQIFQIFTGQYADDAEFGGKVLSNMKWGLNGKKADGTKPTVGDLVEQAILDELEAFVTDSKAQTPDQSAQATGDLNKERLAAIQKYVDLTSTPFQDDLADVDAVKAVTMDNGYYLVRVKPGTVADGEAYPTYTVNVVDNKITNFKPKGIDNGVPTVTKKTEDNKAAADAAIGNVVKFTVSGNLPANLHDYYEYFLTVNDTMSAGLTWAAAKNVGADAAGVVSAKIGGVDVLDKMYVGEKAADGKIVMGFANILDMGMTIQDGAAYEIVYQAIVNKDAVIATADNTNKAVLFYSSDPNNSNNGLKNDPSKEPDPGETPVKTTIETNDTKTETWLTGLTVEQFTERGQGIEGSVFELSGTNLNVVLTYTSTFTEAADGIYYHLLGTKGGYTTAVPTEDNKALYESDGAGGYKMYSKTNTVVTDQGQTAADSKVTATIDANGNLSITGLKAGDYTLTNVSIPDGFTLAKPISFTLSFDETNKFTSNNALVAERTPDWFYVTLISGDGVLLPETGGTGVYVLYAVGGLLMAGALAAFIVISKKKNNDAE